MQGIDANPNPTSHQAAARARTALGLPATWTPPPGTTPTLTTWSLRELDGIYALLGGAVTASAPAADITGDVYFTLTLTAPVPGLGEVTIDAEWYPATQLDVLTLPVLRALAGQEARQ
ncbi:hypothetical protein [Streptomyces sp. NPDC088674]|uniref:hypothetical protein n=1 Tax=Streptomyces sp. NPDC088674 TaxID=3365869 RepID=UPI003830402C